jgi:acyl-CoA thioester hydrolase
MEKYHTYIRVTYGDTDAMGVVWHGNYTRYFEIGRTEALREIGYPYDAFEAKGLMMPLHEMWIHYKTPARFDDLLDVTSWIRRITAARIVISYEIRICDADLVVTGETTHAITDRDMKPVNIHKRYPEFSEKMISLAEFP